MKNLLRLFTLVFALVLLPLSTVSAENSVWKDPSFNFGNVRYLKLGVIDFYEYTQPKYIEDSGASSKLEITLRQAASKKGITILTEQDLAYPAPNATPNTASIDDAFKNTAPYLNVKCFSYGHYKTWREPWLETRTEYREERYKDSYGRWQTRTYPETIYVNHPGYYEDTAVADMEFIVTDPQTGRVVLTYRDTRDRVGNDAAGMVGRICDEFAKNLTKK